MMLTTLTAFGCLSSLFETLAAKSANETQKAPRKNPFISIPPFLFPSLLSHTEGARTTEIYFATKTIFLPVLCMSKNPAFTRFSKSVRAV